MAGPLDGHALYDDPLSAGAVQTISVGDRSLLAVSDGFIRIPKTFLGTRAHPSAGYDALEADYGDVRLPIGSFLLQGDRNALIDTGVGPVDFNGLGVMIGGRLLEHLNQRGVHPRDIDVIALSHLHNDHIGWLADKNGVPVFSNAVVHVGAEDWDYFIESRSEPSPAGHIVHALRTLADRGQVELIDNERQIVPGLTRLPAPGHTPGHSIYVIHDAHERVLLFGDALYCPHQLSNDDWSAMSDVDPIVAKKTRERYVRSLESDGGRALGCHFPELIAARGLGPRAQK